MRRFIAIVWLLAFISIVGCGSNVSMRGKVAYDDGSPLTMGMVVVENQSVMARGEIQPDGSYVIGSLSKRDGLPPGEYQVYITGAAKVVGSKPNGDPLRELLVEKKYSSPDSSGLSIKVQKSTTYDITVTKPDKPVFL